MPFRTTDTLPESPSVVIFFHGLLLLQPDGNHCQVGVHRRSERHRLTVAVRVKRPPRPDVILARIIDLLEPPGLSIAVGHPTATGVSKFIYSEDCDITKPGGHDNDFRRIVDLQDPKVFHGRQLNTKEDGISPGIHLAEGTLYTAQKTDNRKVKIRREGGGKKPLKLDSIASIVGANIYLPEKSAVVMKWQQGGIPQTLSLSKADLSAGIHYEIYIDNSPLFEDPTHRPTHYELEEYYKVIENVRQPDQFEIKPEPPEKLIDSVAGGSAKFDNRGSARVPCMPITLGG
jgi:hypothetical protein